MAEIDLNDPLEVQSAGFHALREALGPAGAVRFLQLYTSGRGDYTKERQSEPDADPDEVIAALKEYREKKQQI
ncbi:MAG: hypothetical protein LUC17_02430 [Oscillospiraceae bacterium]|nr:hypothetical protein [Oscillospiraceae bacterium]